MKQSRIHADSVPIYQGCRFLGDLVAGEDGETTFIPNPLEPQPFGDMTNHIENLLPEGARDKWYRSMRRLPSDSVVGYMRRFGEDLAGDISSRPNGIRGKSPDRTREISRLVAEGAPLDATVRGQKSLLAGADPKIAVIVENGRFLMPDAGNPSTHILKYGNRLCLNEHFCMRLMSECGIPSANTELLCIEGREALLVERFDRADGERLLAADFCQLLSRGSEEKYRITWDEIGVLLAVEKIGRQDRERLFDATAFNIVLGCCDDHAKNFSLVGESRESLRLAPFYDVASMTVAKRCSRAYARLDTWMPRAIGSQNRQHKLKRKHLMMLAEILGLDPNGACRRFGRIVAGISGYGRNLLSSLESHVEGMPFSSDEKSLHARFFREMEAEIAKKTVFFSRLADSADPMDEDDHRP